MQNIILHIPHSSLIIPDYDGYVVDRDTLMKEMNLVTDWFTEELFDLPFQKIVTPYSRIFCDVERFEDDLMETMSVYGMGMCYTHLDNGQVMRNVTLSLKRKIRDDYYIKHHTLLEQIIAETISSNNKAIVIDCHSFPDLPLNRDLIKETPRPDFCIGVDDFHTPKLLSNSLVNFLSKQGYQVKINNPYSGTIIPLNYYKKERSVQGIMIEVNRKLYMSASNVGVSKSENFDNIKSLIKNLITSINK